MWFQGFDVLPDRYKSVPEKWEAMNPGWQVLRWDYRNLSDFIRKYYPQYFQLWNRIQHTDKKLETIKKCDFARLLLVHYFGGVYVDCDLVPQRGLDSLLDSGVVLHRGVGTVRYLPDPPQVSPIDLRSFDIILSREHRPIEENCWGVANGLLISKPQQPLWLRFIESRAAMWRDPVLKFLGPHALTAFLRGMATNLKGKVFILPQFYFLWERHAFAQPMPEWAVSEHLAVNNWGDKTRPDWWNA